MKRVFLSAGIATIMGIASCFSANAADAPPIASTPGASGEAADTPAVAPSATDAGEIQTIVVTARRKKEDPEHIPQAVTALSGDDLKERGTKSSLDLQNLAPSLNVSGNLGQRDADVFTIRGQSQPFGGAHPGVQTYFAEVPFNAGGPGVYFDLDNVQVLNGPQGTLFGRNTTGGAVLFEPKRPTNEIGGYVTTTAGNYGLREFQGALNVPIVSDKLLLRVAGDVTKRDGFTDDVTYNRKLDDEDHNAIRVGLTARPFEGFENYLLVDSYRSNNNGTASILTAFQPGTPAALLAGTPFVPPTGTSLQDALDQQNARGPRSVALDTYLFNRTELFGVTDIASYEFTDNLRIRNIFGYRTDKEQPAFDYDGSSFPILNLPDSRTWQTNALQVTEELQLQGESFGKRLSWIAGYYHELDRPNGYAETYRQQLGTLGGSEFQTTNSRTESNAIFAQATYDLSALLEGLSFTAGGRLSWDRATPDTYDCVPSTPSDCAAPLPNGSGAGADFHAPTWTLAASYQATPATLFYATTRRGYKSGGFNAGAPSTPIDYSKFNSEYLTDVEIGAKTLWRLFGIRGRTNVDVYYGWYKDVQKNDFACVDRTTGSVGSGSVFSCVGPTKSFVVLTVNGAKANISGLEYSTGFALSDALDLDLYYSYTHAVYDTFKTFSGDHASDPFAYTPTHKFGVTGTYTMRERSIGTPVVTATYFRQSKVWFSDFADQEPDAYQDSYGVMNMRLDVNGVFGSTADLGFFVNNITDETYKIGANALESTVGTVSSIYGAPRMFGVELTYRFGGG